MSHPRRSIPLLLGALPLLVGCGAVQRAAETPGKLAGMVFPGTQTQLPPPGRVLKDLLRYADRISLRVGVALKEFEARGHTPAATIQAAEWRLEILRVSTQQAAGPNPFEGLLDLVLLVTFAGWVQEDHWIGVWGEAARPMQLAFADLSAEGLRLLERSCDKKHLDETRELLRRWRQEHPRLSTISMLELPSFASLLEQGPEAAAGASSLLGMVGLDPLAGLEPTARELARSRELAERLLFFVGRAPQLVTLEVGLRLLHARQSDEVRQVLADLGRVTASVESFAATAADLPTAIGKEREAAVRQLNETMVQQRQGLLDDLETAQAPLGSVMQQTQATLTAGERMSTALTGALQALDGFVARIAGPAPRPAPVAPVPAPPPGKPFDIAEYGIAAERIGGAVNQLNSLVTALDQRLPEVQRILDEATARGGQAIDHATTRLFLIGLSLIAAAAVAVLLVRRIGPRRTS